MKLLIEQKIFSFRDCFSVLDESGNERYYVKSALFSWGKKLYVTNAEGREVAYIEQQLFTFRPRYAVYADGHLIGEVVKEFSFFRPSFSLDCRDWQVEGDLFEWDYEICDRDGNTVASISKELFNFTDTYTINVREPVDSLHALMVVLAIDAEKCSRN
jgi:uncharacterized protein YxjI